MSALPSLAATIRNTRLPRPVSLRRQATLAEVLDRVLTKGAVVTGEIVISVAGVDLVYLGLNVVLTSIETARQCKLRAGA